MQTLRHSLRRGFLLILLFLSADIRAGEIWDGGGADSKWTTDANWDGLRFGSSPPNNGTANIHFAGNDNTIPNVDIPYRINSLTFDALSVSFFITGQELTIGAGGVRNNDDSAQVVTAPVKLAASQTWNAAGSLLQANAINLNGFSLTMGGAFNTTLNGAISGNGSLTLPESYTATVTLSGSDSNTFTGTTRVDGGTLVLSKTGGDVAIAGEMIIGLNFAPSATVRLGANEQISHAAGNLVIIQTDGLLDLNGHTETIADLALYEDAAVTTGTGKLIVGERIRRLIQAGGLGSATITGNVDLNGGMPSIGGGDQNFSLVIDGVISNGGVTFGDGVFLRGAANTYAGPTIVNGALNLNKSGVDGGFRGDVTIRGSVSLSASEQILAAPGNEVFLDGGHLGLLNFSETIQDLKLKGGSISGTGTLTVVGAIDVLNANEASTIFSALNLAGTRSFNVQVDADLILSGIVSNGSIVKNGTGTLALRNSANSFSGGVFINQGAVEAESDAQLGALAGAIHFDGGILRVAANSFMTTARLMTWGPNGGGFDIVGINSPFTVNTQSFSGPGPLTKVGAGKLVLLAPQSYTGGTTVAAGTLEGNTQTLQGNIVTQASGTVAFNQATDGTYAGNLSGSGALSKLGAGTLQLTGNNTFTGLTLVNAGILRVAGGNAIGDLSAVTLANAAGVMLNLADSNETIGSLAGGGATGGNVVLGSGTLTTGGNNTSTTFAGIISGTGGVVKAGSGVFTPTGANTYAGGTTLVAGVLSAGSDANLGAPAGALRFDGGTLRVTGGFNTAPRSVELLAGGGGLDIANTANSFTYAGNITGPGGLTKVGTGTLILQGSNTYGGPTAINAGTLRAAGGNAIPDGSAVTLAATSDAYMELSDPEVWGSLAGGGPAGGNVSIEGGTLTTGGNNSSTTFAGVISGAGGLIKTGAGVFMLSGNNAYTGLTDVQQGTLRLGAVTGVPNDNAVNVAAGATLDLNGFDKTLSSLTGTGQVLLGTGQLTLGAADATSSFAGAIAGSGRLVKVGAGTLTLDGANSYTGGTTVLAGRLRGSAGGGLQGNIINQSIVEFTQTTDGSYSGVLSGPGSLIKTGPGRATIALPATYTGTTTISAGTLHVPDTLNARGSAILIEANGTLEASGIIQRRISGAGALTATGNLVAGDLSSTNGFNLGAVNVGSYGVVLLDADRAQIGGGTIVGGSLTTLGGLALSGGTFSGRGTVNGTFINNGIVAGPAAPAALSFAGPLSGAGSFSGNIRILDSFSPGNSPAAVAAEGDLQFGATARLTMELAGTNPGEQYDQLHVARLLSLDGALDVMLLDGFQPRYGDRFDLLDFGALTGQFGAIQLPALDAGMSWDTSALYSTGAITAVPEPGTLALVGSIAAVAGLALALRRWKR